MPPVPRHVTGGSSPPGHDPPVQFPRSCTSRHARIAVHVEAPSALAAALASSAAQPRPLRGRPHPAQLQVLEGYGNPYVNPLVNPHVNPLAPGGVPGLAFGVGVAAGKSPLGGEVRARLIHSSAVRLEGAAFGGDRYISRPAAVWSARNSLRTFGAPPSSMAIPFQPCRGQARTERYSLSPTEHHACLLRSSRSVRHLTCSPCCDEPFHRPRRDEAAVGYAG